MVIYIQGRFSTALIGVLASLMMCLSQAVGAAQAMSWPVLSFAIFLVILWGCIITNNAEDRILTHNYLLDESGPCNLQWQDNPLLMLLDPNEMAWVYALLLLPPSTEAKYSIARNLLASATWGSYYHQHTYVHTLLFLCLCCEHEITRFPCQCVCVIYQEIRNLLPTLGIIH